jgi:hypothetical protein
MGLGLVKVDQVVASGKLSGKTTGPHRFYYDSRDGRVPYAQVSDGILARLESGRAALVESPDGAVTLVDAKTARQVVDLDREWLRVWNGR